MPAVGSHCCPYCREDVELDVAMPFGAVKCTSCGRPLLFLTISGSRSFFRESDSKFVWQLFSGVPEHQRFPEELDPDSLDTVEYAMELEAAVMGAG
jgi:hypothetical protein